MSLHTIPGHDFRLLADLPDNDDPATFAPSWLIEELRAMPAFVSEALGEAHESMTAAVIADSPIELLAAARKAVGDYIEHIWERENRDAQAISKSWREWQALQDSRRAAA